jgi:hypothetical protein
MSEDPNLMSEVNCLVSKVPYLGTAATVDPQT